MDTIQGKNEELSSGFPVEGVKEREGDGEMLEVEGKGGEKGRSSTDAALLAVVYKNCMYLKQSRSCEAHTSRCSFYILLCSCTSKKSNRERRSDRMGISPAWTLTISSLSSLSHPTPPPRP